MPWLAEVILPIPVKSVYTYLIPDEWMERVDVGYRVTAPLGVNKLLTGVIARMYEAEIEYFPENFKPKTIEAVPDAGPVLLENQLELIRWIAFYYCCSEGEVLNLCIPASLKPESLLHILPGENLPPDGVLQKLTHQAFFHQLVASGKLTLPHATKILNIKYPHPRLQAWKEQGWITYDREMQVAYRPRMRTTVEIAPEFRDKEALELILKELEKTPKRELVFIQIVSAWFAGKKLTPSEIKKITGVSESVLKTLERQGYIVFTEEQIDRTAGLEFNERGVGERLTEEQTRALAEIRNSFQENPQKPVLIQGITGSGKTRVYQELIREVVEQEKQVLYLIPEIALTRQIIDRMKSEFGEKVGVYHSRFNDQERVEIWNKVLEGHFQIVIGVRSSVFLPFRDLGLIVVDEEQDQSFRQHERPPFYHARNVALWYARHFKIPIVMGSATPSMESRYNAEMGRFFLVKMKERAQNAIPPAIFKVDMHQQEKNGLSRGIFSDVLIHELENCLQKGEQAILLQNRRGFATVQICKACGTMTRCINCDISLSWHKHSHEMKCHYCGYNQDLSHRCEACGSMQMALQGYGTERVEEELGEIFPHATIVRMDQDSTRRKNASDQIIERMEQGSIDILVGTQMVSKGLDFEKVSLVGIINADQTLGFPDFRATEQAYQLFTQVAGRAGRRSHQGRVVIQTRKSSHVVFELLESDFDAFYEWEKINRQSAHYPPFTRLIRLEIRHAREDAVTIAGDQLGEELSKNFGKSVLGPEAPLIPRIRNENRLQFLIKINPTTDAVKVRKTLLLSIENFDKTPASKGVKIRIEVDP
jgi:primosomal protein N' (replication factor Y)